MVEIGNGHIYKGKYMTKGGLMNDGTGNQRFDGWCDWQLKSMVGLAHHMLEA
jgi:hypothetical protein